MTKSDTHWFYIAKFKNRKKRSIRPVDVKGALIFIACILGFVVGINFIYLSELLVIRALCVLSMILSSAVFIYGVGWKTDKDRPPQ